MLEMLMQTDVFSNALVPPVASIIAFAVLLGIVWNISRKFTTLELDVKTLKEAVSADILRMQNQHIKDAKALEMEIQRQVVERRDDIAKTSLQHKDDLNNIQSQLDASKADIKGLLSKIEVAYTSIHTGEKTHDEQKAEIHRLHSFYADWIQRVEDRIENLRDEFLSMFAGFHGSGSRGSKK